MGMLENAALRRSGYYQVWSREFLADRPNRRLPVLALVLAPVAVPPVPVPISVPVPALPPEKKLYSPERILEGQSGKKQGNVEKSTSTGTGTRTRTRNS